jgi:YD repeat-containing protein
MNPLGEVTTYVYNGNACPIATIDPLGNRHTLSFDGSGEVQAEIDPLGNRTTYTLEYGQRVAVQNPLGYVTHPCKGRAEMPYFHAAQGSRPASSSVLSPFSGTRVFP